MKKAGNTKPDQAWFAEIQAAGEFQTPDHKFRPDGFLHDVKFQWIGLAEEVNLEFFESFRRNPNMRRCNGTAYIRDADGMYIIDAEWNKLRRPCLSPPARGATVCYAHGAGIPAVKAAAQRVMAEASEVVATRLVTLTGVRDEEDGAIAHKDRIAAANSVLDRVGIKAGGTLEVEIKSPGYRNVVDRLFSKDEDIDG